MSFVVKFFGPNFESPLINSGNGNGKSSLNRQSSVTPLQKFVEVKNRINQVFQEVEKYVRETSAFLKGKKACQMKFLTH